MKIHIMDRGMGRLEETKNPGAVVPSRELTYPTWGSSENHLQNAIFEEYVNFPGG